MAIEFITFSESGFTLFLVSICKELGIDYKLSAPAKLEDIKTPEYLATKHPFGKVPVLIDDGFQIYESSAIARYLISKYQKTKTSTILIPTDLQKAALVNQFISVGYSYFSDPAKKLISQEFNEKHEGVAKDPEVVKEACEELNKVFDIYEKLLEGKDYLAGEFSLADILHSTIMQCIVHFGHGDLIENRPNISKWWKNLSERECWKSTIAENKHFST
ncbi:4846_t:CDS:2 [Funneliformis caledonium]|uniref:glutathione transferase n=1 Tax=Funneliformis caledonium TaxID=1117310 RepID=A0A9N9IN00_9GLOM|nr:4846_t:CDS:2 [Funneliformis caledonium]